MSFCMNSKNFLNSSSSCFFFWCCVTWNSIVLNTSVHSNVFLQRKWMSICAWRDIIDWRISLNILKCLLYTQIRVKRDSRFRSLSVQIIIATYVEFLLKDSRKMVYSILSLSENKEDLCDRNQDMERYVSREWGWHSTVFAVRKKNQEVAYKYWAKIHWNKHDQLRYIVEIHKTHTLDISESLYRPLMA